MPSGRIDLSWDPVPSVAASGGGVWAAGGERTVGVPCGHLLRVSGRAEGAAIGGGGVGGGGRGYQRLGPWSVANPTECGGVRGLLGFDQLGP